MMLLSLELKMDIEMHKLQYLAPTGTIGLLMDCDTTGVEPDFRVNEV